MTQSETRVELARNVVMAEAGRGLPPATARLYSQFSRLQARQPGLPSWNEYDSSSFVNEAVRLLDSALVLRTLGNGASWQSGLRRVGELFEWLSLPELNPDNLPLRMLAAAAYQLAGYPARATGLLNTSYENDNVSPILKRSAAGDSRVDKIPEIEAVNEDLSTGLH